MLVSRAALAPSCDLHPATWALLRTATHGGGAAYRPDPAALVEALRETTAWHHQRNGLYRKYCAHVGFDPGRDLDAVEAVDRLPHLSAELLRRWPVTAGGSDLEGEARRVAMLAAVMQAEGLVTGRPVHHVLFARPPGRAARPGGERFFAGLCELAPPGAVTYGLRERADRTLGLDEAGVSEALRRASITGEPVRVVGLPALVARVARGFDAWPVKLGMGSLVLTSGGWDGAELSRADFRALVARAWGVPPQRALDLYRMDEHPVTYVECTGHAFHAPAFARARVVDPLTLDARPPGEPGVLALVSPGATALPSHALLTTDVARSVECPCGRAAPAFEILGRGGKGAQTGFAARLLEMIDR